MKTLLVIDMQKGFMKNDRYKVLNKRIKSLISNSQYDKRLCDCITIMGFRHLSKHLNLLCNG